MATNVEFTKCPKCNGPIPKHWATHLKCGYNISPEIVEQKVEEIEDNNTPPEYNLILSCRDFVLKNFSKDEFPDGRHTLVNSLFIALNRRLK